MANPADNGFFIAKETVAGAIPATPALKRFPHTTGDTFQFESDFIESNIMMPNRTKAAPTKAGFRVSGELKTHFKRDDTIESLLESVMSNTFVNNVLTRGTTNQPYTIQKQFKQANTLYYQNYVNNQVSTFALTCEANTAAECTFTFVGADEVGSGTTNIVGATYPASTTNGKLLTGLDVRNVTVSGITGIFQSLDLTIESPREAAHGFGSPGAVLVDQNGAGSVSLTLKLFRTDLTPETALAKSDTPITVSFEIGTGANGYRFTLPAAVSETPKSEDEGVASFVTLVFVGSHSAGTDVSITRLTA